MGRGSARLAGGGVGAGPGERAAGPGAHGKPGERAAGRGSDWGPGGARGGPGSARESARRPGRRGAEGAPWARGTRSGPGSAGLGGPRERAEGQGAHRRPGEGAAGRSGAGPRHQSSAPRSWRCGDWERGRGGAERSGGGMREGTRIQERGAHRPPFCLSRARASRESPAAPSVPTWGIQRVLRSLTKVRFPAGTSGWAGCWGTSDPG